MESISGHDAYKTASPAERYSEKVVERLERNLENCPFCLARPFFEDEAGTCFVYVSCHCGASICGIDWDDVAAKWSTRPIPVARKVLREGPRAYWPGA